MSTNETWITITVVLHGLKVPMGRDTESPWLAKVELCTKTQKLRAPTNPEERVLFRKRLGVDTDDILGAPRFHLVEDKPRLVVLLDQLYSA